MDITTHQYSTLAWFLRNSQLASKIIWYEAAPDAEPLDFASGIVNLDWENDRDLFQDELGEIWGAPRPYQPGVIPPGIGGHVCGTPDDFRYGGIYDPIAPATRYGAFGWPLCCGPPAAVFGGAGASGRCVLQWVTPDATVGGLVLGGSAGDVLTLTDPTEGGTQIGGTAGDLIATNDPTEGGTQIGGTAGDVWTVPDATEGGVEIGGEAGDAFTYFDQADGGTEIGGATGDGIATNDPTSGGTEIGGATGDVILTIDSTSGGTEIGGATGDVFAYLDATDGGMELGGEAGDIYVPGQPTPGTSCATAASVNQGQTYSYTRSLGPTDQWFTFVIPSTGNWHIATTGLGGFGAASFALFRNGTCPTPGPLGGWTFGPPRWFGAATVGDVIWIKVQSPLMGSTAYTFVWDSGL